MRLPWKKPAMTTATVEAAILDELREVAEARTHCQDDEYGRMILAAAADDLLDTLLALRRPMDAA